MAARTYLNESRIPAESIPNYIGWNLNGALARDGSLLWGKILSAELREVRGINCLVVSYARNIKGTTVPDGQTISLTDFNGPHYLTITKAARFADCNGGESVGVDTVNGLELHAGDGFWHPWNDEENN